MSFRGNLVCASHSASGDEEITRIWWDLSPACSLLPSNPCMSTSFFVAQKEYLIARGNQNKHMHEFGPAWPWCCLQNQWKFSTPCQNCGPNFLSFRIHCKPILPHVLHMQQSFRFFDILLLICYHFLKDWRFKRISLSCCTSKGVTFHSHF